MTPHPIDVAAGILGSQAALAEALGVSRAAVTQWKEDGRKTPAEHCPKIERLCEGRVTCEQLRPDMEWGVLRVRGVVDLELDAIDRRDRDRRQDDRRYNRRQGDRRGSDYTSGAADTKGA